MLMSEVGQTRKEHTYTVSKKSLKKSQVYEIVSFQIFN